MRYVVVGGIAVIFHGYVRFTGDIDFFYESVPVNAERLFRALTAFWKGEIPYIREPDELLEDGLILQFGRPPDRIDLLGSVKGISFNQAWESRIEAVLVGGITATLPILGLEPLIVSKRSAGCPKDLEDLRYLEANRSSPPPP